MVMISVPNERSKRFLKQLLDNWAVTAAIAVEVVRWSKWGPQTGKEEVKISAIKLPQEKSCRERAPVGHRHYLCTKRLCHRWEHDICSKNWARIRIGQIIYLCMHVCKIKLCSCNVGRSQVDLVRQGLIGKIHLTLRMDEREKKSEICLAFSTAINDNPTFKFTYVSPSHWGRGQKPSNNANNYWQLVVVDLDLFVPLVEQCGRQSSMQYWTTMLL